MMSYSSPIQMYQKSHEFNMYPGPGAWYNHSRPQNNQYLAGTAGSGIGAGLDSDPSAAPHMYYNTHHPMFAQSSPDFSGHDNFAYAAAAHHSPLLQSPMGQTTNGLQLNHHHHNGHIENLSNGMQNIPPSPPITVNSGCSEMSSPGITNGGSSGGGMGNGSSSPHMNNGNGNLSRPKSPYEWMKKPSYQSQSQPGTSS